MSVAKQLPVVKSYPYKDPIAVFALFAHDPFALLLESSKEDVSCGRYSFIAVNPFDTFVCRAGSIKMRHRHILGNPWDVLEQLYSQYAEESVSDCPGFQGGLAGYFGYELGQHLEKLPAAQEDAFGFPDCMLGLYDLVIAFDHSSKTMRLISQGWPEQLPAQRFARAKARMLWLLGRLEGQPRKIRQNPAVNVKPLLSKARYCEAIQSAIEFIYAGDIFEVNLSQRFVADLPKGFDFLGCYQTLRAINPAPFSGYFNAEDQRILSASPERFLSLANNKVSAKPIKGTKPRGQTLEEDKRLAAALLKSEKDRAENVMIVDLLRNDLAKVCDYNSIQVTKLCALESFETVHHLVSTIEGHLQPGKSPIDLLKAAFPGGSITGAPKIRSMEIITALEGFKRGPYCGCLGYVGFHGAMDLSILIRSIFANKNCCYVQAGGAIVSDSDPLAECQETYDKAAALLKVLGG